jgi:tetratricopeptide (TPR) repeat protein
MQTASDAHLAGVQELQQGRAESALPLLEKAVALSPDVAQFHHDLGSALAMLGKHAEALGSLAEAIKLAPNEAWIRADAGMSLLALGENVQGLNELQMAVQMAPDDPRLLINFGMALGRFGAHEQAEQWLTYATQLAPQAALAWTLLADSLWVQGKWDSALPAADRAVQLAPDDAAAQLALGNALQMTAHFEQAAAAFRTVLKFDPDVTSAQQSLAQALRKMGRIDESLAEYDKVLTRSPEEIDARVDRALVLLTLGRYDEGFTDYELRSQLPHFAERMDRTRQRWDGSDPAGKAIVIINDQGMGDLIQFIRYAPLLADRGARVWVACPPALESIIMSVRGVSGVIDLQSPAMGNELWVWEASLPAMFKTTIDTIPADMPYVRADTPRVDRWRKRLASDPNFKVGLVWAGEAMNDNDRARSCRLSDLTPLAMEGITFYSLQKGPPAVQAADPLAGINLIDLAPELNDFGDTAAVMECLDLIITVDTAAAHLAGALARPVWTLLYKGADWHYPVGRSDSPWYPTMRLFRQSELNDWSSVAARVAEELRAKVQEKRG